MPIRLSETLKRLLIVYVVVFVIQQTIDQFFGGHLKAYLALIPNAVLGGYVWQILTYGFLHADVMHLLLNLLVLAFVGSDIESVWGRRKFLIYYFFCVLSAGLFYLIVQFLISNPLYLSLPMLGASGGIYGLLYAYGVLFPDREMLLMMLFPIRARQFVWVLAGIEFLQAIYSGQGGLGAIAHLSGMGAGFLYLYFEARGLRLPRGSSNPSGPAKKKNSHLRLVKDEDDQTKGPKTWH